MAMNEQQQEQWLHDQIVADVIANATVKQLLAKDRVSQLQIEELAWQQMKIHRMRGDMRGITVLRDVSKEVVKTLRARK